MEFDPQLLARLLVAAACGAAVGWEREWRHKPAGLRTYMLVATGSAAFTLGAVRLAQGSPIDASNPIDPTRVIQGIVGGIGFLGAGAIIQLRGSVEGLTTAAGVWVMGAIGVGCGLGYYDIALTTTVMAVLIVGVMGAIAARFTHAAHAKQGPTKVKANDETTKDDSTKEPSPPSQPSDGN